MSRNQFTSNQTHFDVDEAKRTMAKAGDRYELVTGNIWSYANRGDLTGLKAALARGVDVNLQNTVGWT